jgi:putative oxidoreductase
LVSGKFMRAFLLILLPISVNIFLLHAVVTKSDLPMACFVLIANIFLIYAYWNSYKHLFDWK